ncbi:MAG TPA: alpha/beta fold hydrolase [Candidatus Saccharimonadales bacterium]|jgi:predicted alpha/beta-hydrolase family hydrolase|nr:alpha/beta fold hydrolase [Candidatus Saccharimonadales bacterium]
MLQGLTYKYYHKQGARTVYLVLHGGGPAGIETPFIANIIEALTHTDSSVFGFNFPYCERGEERSSGPELPEETAALHSAVQFLHNEGYEQIVIVAKSLGGVTTSYWLAQHPDENVTVAILGYVVGSVKTEQLRGKLRLVLQGEHDRFGNASAVEAELAEHSVAAHVIEIPKADHSYRNEQQEPAYQAQAIDLLVQNVRSVYPQ